MLPSATGPDAVLIDAHVHVAHAIDIGGALRRCSAVPILVLAGTAETARRIEAASGGAERCLIEPYQPAELMARLHTLIEQAPMRALCPPWQVDRSARTVAIGWCALDLTPSEFRLLETLLLSEGQTFSRTALLDSIQSERRDVCDRAIDIHVRSLRRKIAPVRSCRACCRRPPKSHRPLVSLKTVPVPGPSEAVLRTLVRDRAAAVQLGKALFWDTRVGSDNRTACATCHFHAGADARVKNEVSPGLLAGDTGFSVGRGPNHTLTLQDFPLTRFASLEPGAAVVRDSNDVIASQGVFTTAFNSVSRRGGADDCSDVSDAVSHGGTGFNLNGVNTRRVEPRNAPSVFNAVFNFRNFWNGRANNSFNGVDPFGLRNANARIWRLEQGVLREAATSLPSASLMSLSSGPPLSENEMSCRGRTFADLARKLGEQPILADQQIDARDGVLAHWPSAGRPTTNWCAALSCPSTGRQTTASCCRRATWRSRRASRTCRAHVIAAASPAPSAPIAPAISKPTSRCSSASRCTFINRRWSPTRHRSTALLKAEPTR